MWQKLGSGSRVGNMWEALPQATLNPGHQSAYARGGEMRKGSSKLSMHIDSNYGEKVLPLVGGERKNKDDMLHRQREVFILFNLF